MKKFAASLGLTLALTPLLFFGCQSSQAKTSAHSSAYWVQLPIVRNATKLIELEGEFKPSKYTQLFAESSGKIATLFVEDGEYVEQGQPLLEFDTTLTTLAVNNAESEYQQAKTSVIELSQTTNEQDPRFLAALRGLEETRSNLLLAQQRKQASTVYAPFSGKLGQIQWNAGNYINEGELITELVATNTVELHFSASSQTLNVFRQALNQDPNHLVVSIPSSDGTAIEGKLQYIDAKLNGQTDTLDGYALFANSNGEHLIGSKVRFYLNYPQPEPLLLVPQAAIHHDDGIPTLFVLDENNVVLPQQVSIEQVKENFAGYVPLKSGITDKSFVLTTPEAPELVGKKVDPMINLIGQLNEVLKRQS